MPNTLTETDWDTLIKRIKEGQCTPFLGAGLCYGILPLGKEIATGWAEANKYPLKDCCDLARVAQFLAVTRDPMFPKEELRRQFKKVPPPDFDNPSEPHRILASLPFPIYITTNYDDFMTQALKRERAGGDVKREYCRWNSQTRRMPSIIDAKSEITPSNPVVFHLHGHLEVPQSMVLTEDDYLDFLVAISKSTRLLPAQIQGAFGGTSLLFLGYRLADVNFRVLFRSLVSYLEKSLSRTHISVQLLPPQEDVVAGVEKDKVQEYFDNYFGDLHIRVYWGTCLEFIADLKSRWEAASRG
jgi:hypothetical protein